ncbi:hypothetical protein V8F20_003489 [Naviculisporaceae sp. PSN 640]
MSTVGWAFLEVQVTFPVINPPSDASVSIKFPEPEQAQWYYGYILSKPFVSANRLYPKHRDNSVTVRLPSRFTRISASTRCDGFFFTVTDRKLADDWVANMLVWRAFPEYTINPNHTQIGVVRNWSHDPIISPHLLACLPPSKTKIPPALPPRPNAGQAQAAQAPPLPPQRELGGALGSNQGVYWTRPPQAGPFGNVLQRRELGDALGSSSLGRPPPPPPPQPRDVGEAVGSRFNTETGYAVMPQQGFGAVPGRG